MAKQEVRTLKQKQREERIALIRDVAYELLNEKGYYEMSMDEIAARVGISKGALYLHFKSKEDLVFTIINEEIERFLLLIDQIIAQDLSVQQRLEQILLETYKSIHSGRQLIPAFNSLGLDKGLLGQRLDEQVSMTGLMERLTKLFEEGKAKGEFNDSVPTPIMLSVFLGFLQIYSNDRLAINQNSPEDLLPSVRQLLFHGLLATS